MNQVFVNWLAFISGGPLISFVIITAFKNAKSSSFIKASTAMVSLSFFGGACSVAPPAHATISKSASSAIGHDDPWKIETISSPSILESSTNPPEVHKLLEPEAANLIEPTTYVVQAGDNLWKISQNLAGKQNSFELWRQIIKDNTHVLKSKNPDLIYPGETISINYDVNDL